jgi:hypothetical protein
MSKVGENRDLIEREIYFSFFEELNQVHKMYRHIIRLTKEIHIKKYSQDEYRKIVDEIVVACVEAKINE